MQMKPNWQILLHAEGIQQFRSPGGLILLRERSATEINEGQFSAEQQSQWCRLQSVTQTSLETNHDSREAVK